MCAYLHSEPEFLRFIEKLLTRGTICDVIAVILKEEIEEHVIYPSLFQVCKERA
jgi:hypothetical protein